MLHTNSVVLSRVFGGGPVTLLCPTPVWDTNPANLLWPIRYQPWLAVMYIINIILSVIVIVVIASFLYLITIPRLRAIFPNLCFREFIFILNDTLKLLLTFGVRLILAPRPSTFGSFRNTFTVQLQFRLVMFNSKIVLDQINKLFMSLHRFLSQQLLVARVLLE